MSHSLVTSRSMTSTWAGLPPVDAAAVVGPIFACVLTYNRKEILLSCLEAILAQSRPPERVLVFDNGSTDGTSEFLEERGLLSNPALTVIRTETNLGPAGGFSALFRHAYAAECGWVWVMDDDVIPERSALEELVKAYATCFGRPEEVGFIVSRVVTPDGQPNNVPDVDGYQDAYNPPKWAQLLHHGMVKIKFSTFCSDLIPRTTIDKFGFPCADFFYGGEDVDYTLRVGKERPGYIVGTSQATHLRAVAGTFHALTERNRTRIPFYFYFYRNQTYLRRSQMGWKLFTLYVLFGVRDIVRVLFKSPLGLSMSKVMLRGLLAGLTFEPRRIESGAEPRRGRNTSVGANLVEAHLATTAVDVIEGVKVKVRN
jgi:GT2 family glycosyltransferase